MFLNSFHHVAIICSDYNKSKHFYKEILGLKIIREIYRAERCSYKLDVALSESFFIELFSFPNPPLRLSQPEAVGLRHLAFGVNNIENFIEYLAKNQIICEPLRIDEFTQKKFTFFNDPDNLPLELYEIS
ncbi:MAG: VOC family protein [Sediminibacterium sp.]|nr:VOC family protein [Sediminibacterium sp.]